jgi:hypothetical protein
MIFLSTPWQVVQPLDWASFSLACATPARVSAAAMAHAANTFVMVSSVRKSPRILT